MSDDRKPLTLSRCFRNGPCMTIHTASVYSLMTFFCANQKALKGNGNFDFYHCLVLPVLKFPIHGITVCPPFVCLLGVLSVIPTLLLAVIVCSL